MTRWLVILCLITVAMTSNAQDDEPTALLGNSSGGSSNMTSAAVEYAFERATDMARASGLSGPSIEHLLLALLDDESVQELLSGQSVDADAIRTALQYHLDTAGTAPDDAGGPGVDQQLQGVMRRALMKSMISNRRESDAGDIIIAILVEGESFAAEVLRAQGLTVDEAEQATLNSFMARQEEQTRRREALQARIAEQRARQVRTGAPLSIRSAPVSGSGVSGSGVSGSGVSGSGVSGSGVSGADVSRRGQSLRQRPYKFRITSETEGRESEFKAAISHDGRLDLYIESTPFEVSFLAARVAALYESLDDDGRLRVELVTEEDGQERAATSAGGRAGAIFDDPASLGTQRSGVLR